MRTAKAKDIWRYVNEKVYSTKLKSINLHGLNGINTLEFTPGIHGICGLNGAGKSTILSSLKKVLGLDLTQKEKLIYQDTNSTIISVTLNDQDYSFSIDNIPAEIGQIRSEKFHFLDYSLSTDVIQVLTQDNLDELVSQHEEYEYTKDEINDMNYIVGKNYTSIKLYEFDEYTNTIPYFKVSCGLADYDSIRMGMGEQYLFFLYWKLRSTSINSILFIEEPETFISVKSQENLMNIMAKFILEKSISIVFTTHSPFIIKNIPQKNLCVLGRNNGSVIVNNDIQFNYHLMSLGMFLPITGHIFVEDYVAKHFLSSLINRFCRSLLTEYLIESVQGESEIRSRLNFPKSLSSNLKFIGVFDGDQINNKDNIVKKAKWPFTFLPIKTNIETEIVSSFESNIQKYSELLCVPEEILETSLSSLIGEEHHDWFMDFSKLISVDKSDLINIFTQVWLENPDNFESAEIFTSDLVSLIKSIQ